ncbi:MAG: hypothetical protein K2L51_01915 [Clostridiales bacterium]|nr:hypothetical protein [Clostridiales bacterium]
MSHLELAYSDVPLHAPFLEAEQKDANFDKEFPYLKDKKHVYSLAGGYELNVYDFERLIRNLPKDAKDVGISGFFYANVDGSIIDFNRYKPQEYWVDFDAKNVGFYDFKYSCEANYISEADVYKFVIPKEE